MAIKIDHNIPIHPIKMIKENTYPFDKMLVGDSFWVVGNKKREIRLVRSEVQNRQRKSDHRYATRTGKSGVRVWRIK